MRSVHQGRESWVKGVELCVQRGSSRDGGKSRVSPGSQIPRWREWGREEIKRLMARRSNALSTDRRMTMVIIISITDVTEHWWERSKLCCSPNNYQNWLLTNTIDMFTHMQLLGWEGSLVLVPPAWDQSAGTQASSTSCTIEIRNTNTNMNIDKYVRWKYKYKGQLALYHPQCKSAIEQML